MTFSGKIKKKPLKFERENVAYYFKSIFTITLSYSYYNHLYYYIDFNKSLFGILIIKSVFVGKIGKILNSFLTTPLYSTIYT